VVRGCLAPLQWSYYKFLRRTPFLAGSEPNRHRRIRLGKITSLYQNTGNLPAGEKRLMRRCLYDGIIPRFNRSKFLVEGRWRGALPNLCRGRIIVAETVHDDTQSAWLYADRPLYPQ